MTTPEGAPLAHPDLPAVVAQLRAMNATNPREIFLYLANHAHEAYLADGCSLLDRTDFTAWLIELSEAFKPEALDQTCGDCDSP